MSDGERVCYGTKPISMTGASVVHPRDTLGANFSQLIIAPALSYKVKDKHVIGVSPLLGLQQVRIRGLASLAPLSSDPTSLSNRGTTWIYG